MRPSITHFTSDGAVFDDGHFEEFDTVVMATGYEYKFPFLDDKVRNINYRCNRFHLFFGVTVT